jgi:hypothetical protein
MLADISINSPPTPYLHFPQLSPLPQIVSPAHQQNTPFQRRRYEKQKNPCAQSAQRTGPAENVTMSEISIINRKIERKQP